MKTKWAATYIKKGFSFSPIESKKRFDRTFRNDYSTPLDGKFSRKKFYKFPTGRTLRNECEYPYKPAMKGGHTHNHIFNVINKKYFKKIYGRKIPKNQKTKFMSTFMYFLHEINSPVSSFCRAYIFGKGKKNNIKKSNLTIFR